MIKKVYFLLFGNFLFLNAAPSSYHRLFNHGLYYVGIQQQNIAKSYWLQALSCRKLVKKDKVAIIEQLEYWCDLNGAESEYIKTLKESIHAKRKSSKS